MMVGKPSEAAPTWVTNIAQCHRDDVTPDTTGEICATADVHAWPVAETSNCAVMSVSGIQTS